VPVWSGLAYCYNARTRAGDAPASEAEVTPGRSIQGFQAEPVEYCFRVASLNGPRPLSFIVRRLVAEKWPGERLRIVRQDGDRLVWLPERE
jgi:hypothetical protein